MYATMKEELLNNSNRMEYDKVLNLDEVRNKDLNVTS